MPGTFKLDHLHSIKPLLSRNFSIFSTFILGGQFLLPQRANNGKGDSSNPKLDETEGFQCLGPSNWSICILLSHFCSDNFPTFSPSYWGGQFLLPQRANMQKREFPQLQNWMRQWVLSAWGIHPGPFAALCTFHFLKIFYMRLG